MKVITISVLAVSLVAGITAAWAADAVPAQTRAQRAKAIYTQKAQDLTPQHHAFAEKKAGAFDKAKHLRAHGAKRTHVRKHAECAAAAQAACCEKAAPQCCANDAQCCAEKSACCEQHNAQPTCHDAK
jgi:hypothetical protein